jgi:hypothetical protein
MTDLSAKIRVLPPRNKPDEGVAVEWLAPIIAERLKENDEQSGRDLQQKFEGQVRRIDRRATSKAR